MISKIKNVKVALLILIVIGLCTGCNGNQDQGCQWGFECFTGG